MLSSQLSLSLARTHTRMLPVTRPGIIWSGCCWSWSMVVLKYLGVWWDAAFTQAQKHINSLEAHTHRLCFQIQLNSFFYTNALCEQANIHTNRYTPEWIYTVDVLRNASAGVMNYCKGLKRHIIKCWKRIHLKKGNLSKYCCFSKSNSMGC